MGRIDDDRLSNIIYHNSFLDERKNILINNDDLFDAASEKVRKDFMVVYYTITLIEILD